MNAQPARVARYVMSHRHGPTGGATAWGLVVARDFQPAARVMIGDRVPMMRILVELEEHAAVMRRAVRGPDLRSL